MFGLLCDWIDLYDVYRYAIASMNGKPECRRMYFTGTMYEGHYKEAGDYLGQIMGHKFFGLRLTRWLENWAQSRRYV
jgi:hypothetical protein